MKGYTGVISFCSWVQCRLGVGKHNPVFDPYYRGTRDRGSWVIVLLLSLFDVVLSTLLCTVDEVSFLACDYGNGTLFFSVLRWLLLLLSISQRFIHLSLSPSRIWEKMESVERECGALGGLFQAVVNDMKVRQHAMCTVNDLCLFIAFVFCDDLRRSSLR